MRLIFILLVGCVHGVLLQEYVFVRSQPGGPLLGPYEVRPFDRFHRNDSELSTGTAYKDQHTNGLINDLHPGMSSEAAPESKAINETEIIHLPLDDFIHREVGNSFEVNDFSLTPSSQDKNTTKSLFNRLSTDLPASNVAHRHLINQEFSGSGIPEVRNISRIRETSVESVITSGDSVFKAAVDNSSLISKPVISLPDLEDSLPNDDFSDDSIDYDIIPIALQYDTDSYDTKIPRYQDTKIDNTPIDLQITLKIELKNSTEGHEVLSNSTVTGDITSKAPEVDDVTSSPCHETCVTILSQMKFSYSPKVSKIQNGDSFRLECSIPFEDESSLRMLWLFQRHNPPMAQCSLTPQNTLNLCGSFASVDHTIDTNFTSKIHTEKLFLSSLTYEDSGTYFCLVELTCCFSNPHVMQRMKSTSTPIEIYDENYALELGVLGGLVGCLVVLLIIGTYLQKKRRRRSRLLPTSKINYPPGVRDVLHAPILSSQEDSDSFDESADEEEA